MTYKYVVVQNGKNIGVYDLKCEAEGIADALVDCDVVEVPYEAGLGKIPAWKVTKLLSPYGCAYRVNKYNSINEWKFSPVEKHPYEKDTFTVSVFADTEEDAMVSAIKEFITSGV